MAMTPEEKFILDLQGYIVIKDVLTDAELAELNEVAVSKFPLRRPGQRQARGDHQHLGAGVHEPDRPPEDRPISSRAHRAQVQDRPRLLHLYEQGQLAGRTARRTSLWRRPLVLVQGTGSCATACAW